MRVWDQLSDGGEKRRDGTAAKPAERIDAWMELATFKKTITKQTEGRYLRG